MTEQQTHLQSVLLQQKQIAEKINSMNNELAIEKEKFLKLQGIVEYLTGIGVKLPTETPEEVQNFEEIEEENLNQ